VRRLAIVLVLATVDAAIIYQKRKEGEGIRWLPLLTYPDALERKVL
jgi:hypothetical protein